MKPTTNLYLAYLENSNKEIKTFSQRHIKNSNLTTQSWLNDYIIGFSLSQKKNTKQKSPSFSSGRQKVDIILKIIFN